MGQDMENQVEITLPEDLTDKERELLLPLARESKKTPGPFTIDELYVRHWCEAHEDGNPVYLDDGAARAHGLNGLMVPPASIFSAVNFPFRWPWPPKGGAKEMINFQVKEYLDLPVGLATDCEMEFFKTIQIGERISDSSRLVSVSPWKKTRVGVGRFIRWTHSYWDELDQKVAEMRVTLFAYGRGEGDSKAAMPKGGYSNALEDAIEGDKTSYQPMVAEGLYWEDVNEGDKLPEIRMPINMTRCVMMASATRDFSPQHSNPEYAKKRSGARDVFLTTPFNMGMVSRMVTDWAGPTSTVRLIKILMRENICSGDELVVTGVVTSKYECNGEFRADIKVIFSNHDGPAFPCEATVALPSRSALKI